VIGFLGRMDEPRKGLPVLLEAFTMLAPERPGLRLLMAGPGDAADALGRLPAALRDRVGVLGLVSEEDKTRAYHSVDIFCAPNTHGESFGIVLAEAMAAGATVLASDIPAFRRVLGEGQAGALFVTGDAGSLAREAAALLDDPARRAKLADEARQAVRKYDWSTVARDVVRVYETVTATAGGGVEEEQQGRGRDGGRRHALHAEQAREGARSDRREAP
jgi:phosphatidylinositol alpha-mannosyltransferase